MNRDLGPPTHRRGALGADADAPADLPTRFARCLPGALEEAYRAYGRRLYAVAMRQLHDHDYAGEAVQRTFAQAWRSAHRYDAARPLDRWLLAICRRAAIDTHRRHRRGRAPLAGPDLDGWPETGGLEFDDVWLTWEVRGALDRLPADLREIVRLAHLERRTHAEIAALLGVPLGTVKSRSHRAHTHLARALGHLRDCA